MDGTTAWTRVRLGIFHSGVHQQQGKEKIMRKHLKQVAFLAVALAGTFSTAIPTATAQSFIALDSTRFTGNQAYTGSLGMDFDVLSSPILVEQLGAFDSGSNGLSFAITVGIFDRTTQTLIGTAAAIDSGDPLMGQSRYEDITDFVLGPGNYSIVAKYFSDADLNGNVGLGGSGPTMNEGGGLIDFVGTSRYEFPVGPFFVYPTTVDTGPENRYDAGTFIYAPVPEPEIYAMLAAGLGFMGFVARRRKLQAVAA